LHPSRALLALLLMVSAGVFTVGVAVERSTVPHTSAAEGSTNTTSTGEQGSEHTGEHGAASGTETSSETFLGIDTESTGLVLAAIAISLVLAAAVWFWGIPAALAFALLFALGAGPFDVREIVHQAQESRGTLVTLATVTALLHGVAVLVAGLLLRGVLRPTRGHAVDAAPSG
jgi:MFS superfamily sulfate permease-like transporter